MHNEKQAGRYKLAIIIALLAMTGSGVYGYWLANLGAPVTSQVGLWVDPANLDLGEIWEQYDFQFTLPIQNLSNEDLTVLELRPSCGCTVVGQSSFTIEPGGKYDVAVTIDLTLAGGDSGQPERELNISLLPIIANAPKPRAPFRLNGKVRSALMVSHNYLTFGDAIVQGMAPPTRAVKVIGHGRIDALRASCDEKWADVHVTEQKGEPNSYMVEITPNSDRPLGTFEFDVFVSATLEDGTFTPPPHRLHVSGDVQSDIGWYPKVIKFGATSVGQEVQDSFALWSHSNSPLDVIAIESGSKDLHADRDESVSSKAISFRVVQKISHFGEQKGAVDIRLKSGRLSAPLNISIPVTYHGVQ